MSEWDFYGGRACIHEYSLCKHGLCEIVCNDVDCQPSLEHEYYCYCSDVGCFGLESDCRGRCGCNGCARAHADFLSGE